MCIRDSIYSEEGAEIMLKHDIVAPVKGITDKIDKNSDLGKAFATYSEKNVETDVYKRQYYASPLHSVM